MPSLNILWATRIGANALAGNITYKTLHNEFMLCYAYLFQILFWKGLSAPIPSRPKFKDVRLVIMECLSAYYVQKQCQIEQITHEPGSWRAVHEHKEM